MGGKKGEVMASKVKDSLLSEIEIYNISKI